MELTDPVTTTRLRLYRPTIHDLDPIHALRAEASTPAQTRHELEGWIAHWDRHGFGIWVVRNDAGEFVGVGGIERGDGDSDDAASLRYALAPRARHHGYATEIVRAALDAAFGKLGLRRVSASVATGDDAAIAVAERAGMTPIGGRENTGVRAYVSENVGRL